MRKVEKTLLKARIPMWISTFALRMETALRLPFRRYPLYRPGCLQQQPVFILGCGRSGNTLLRSMLTAGDELAIPPESYVLPRVIRLFRAYNHLPWPQLVSLIVGEFQGYKEFYTWHTDLAPAIAAAMNLPQDKQTLANIIDEAYKQYAKSVGFTGTRWGDKTPINALHTESIVKVFPTAIYIHLLRDPRAVSLSYRDAGLYNDLESGALFWRSANRAIRKGLIGKESIAVHYEELVNEPNLQLHRLCEYVGISFKNEMMAHHEKVGRLGDAAIYEHHRNTRSAVTNQHVNKWKEELSAAEINAINSIVGEEGFEFYQNA